jgi:rhamnose transport system permease protein
MSVRAQTAPPVELRPEDSGSTGLVQRAMQVRELGIVAVLALVLVIATIGNSRFLTGQSIGDMLLDVSIVAMLAVGQTLVVVMRHLDFSVGSVLGFTAFMTGQLFVTHPGMSIVLVIVIGMLVGAGFGAINGALVTIGRVPALVATLGMLYVIRGVDYTWAHGKQINASDMPSAFLSLGSGNIAGVPYLALIALAVVLAVGTYLRTFRSGRELYAIGSNPQAATLAGIRVSRRSFLAFVASGTLAGLAGVLWAARFGTVDATIGTGVELQVIAAVVVGGVAIFGGSGSVYGAALGAVLLSVIASALVALKVPSFWGEAISGFLLLVAISLDRLLQQRLSALLRRRRVRHAA